MYLKPQKYLASARNFLSSAMHTGRGFIAHVDGAIQRGLDIYATAKPIVAAAADMYATREQKALVSLAARGIEDAGAQYDRGRKLLMQFHGAMG